MWRYKLLCPAHFPEIGSVDPLKRSRPHSGNPAQETQPPFQLFRLAIFIKIISSQPGRIAILPVDLFQHIGPTPAFPQKTLLIGNSLKISFHQFLPFQLRLFKRHYRFRPPIPGQYPADPKRFPTLSAPCRKLRQTIANTPSIDGLGLPLFRFPAATPKRLIGITVRKIVLHTIMPVTIPPFSFRHFQERQINRSSCSDCRNSGHGRAYNLSARCENSNVTGALPTSKRIPVSSVFPRYQYRIRTIGTRGEII